MKTNFLVKIYTNTVEKVQHDISLTLKNKDEIELYEQFTNYLKLEDALFCHKMIEQGYKVSNYQERKLETILFKKIITNEYSYKDIKDIKPINFVNNEMKMMALIHTMPQKRMTYEHFNNKEYNSELETYVQEVFENNENKKLFMNLFKQKLKSLKSCFICKISEDGGAGFYLNNKMKPRAIVKEIEKTLYLTGLAINNNVFSPSEINLLKDIVENTSSYLVKKIDKEFTKEAFKVLGKEALDCFITNVSLMQKENLFQDNQKEVVLNKIKDLNINKKILTDDLINIEHLPIEAKNKVNNIKKIVISMNNEEVNDFVKERVPVIIKKYFNIDEEYRTKLKNVEGFNAQELMLQSLDNIERIVIAKKEDNNYDLLSELSVENRKLKVKV